MARFDLPQHRRRYLLRGVLIVATYYRPNLTAEQRDRLLELVEDQLHCMNWDDPKFDRHYRLVLKLRDCRQISTDAKG